MILSKQVKFGNPGYWNSFSYAAEADFPGSSGRNMAIHVTRRTTAMTIPVSCRDGIRVFSCQNAVLHHRLSTHAESLIYYTSKLRKRNFISDTPELIRRKAKPG